jgi:hypothetical protein
MLSSGLFPGVCSLNADVSEHCLFHLQRRVDAKWLRLRMYGIVREKVWPKPFPYKTPLSQPQSHFAPTRLWRWNRHSFPKRWYLNYRRRGITQKHTTGLHLSDFNENCVFSENFRKIHIGFHENPCSVSRVAPYSETDGRTDRQTERHDEATRISRFSKFCERA